VPSYDYNCSRCGPFTLERPVAEFALPQPCSLCGSESPRLLSAPAVHDGRAAAEPRFPCGAGNCDMNPSMYGGGCGGCFDRTAGA
jgi:putative FmdB family regulatory protein